MNFNYDLLFGVCDTTRQKEILQSFIDNDYNRSKSARELGVNESVVRRSIRRLKEKFSAKGDAVLYRDKDVNSSTTDVEEITLTKRLQDEVKRLKGELNGFQNELVDTEKIKSLIFQGNRYVHKNTTWKDLTKSSKTMNGIPVLFLSDIHFDEVVNPAEINGVNAYNRVIAINRLRYTFETAKKLLIDHFNNPRYDGIVLALGGDLLSGNIHEELSETNEATILQSVLELTDHLISGIEYLESNFGKVFVPCVVGNHGRLFKKPRAKQKVYNNYEYLVYQYLAKYFANNPNVAIEVADGADLYFNIYDKRILLNHGDQFKGGNGISGILTPVMMGLHKKSKNYNMIDKPFDIMMVGHFHQYIHTNSLVVNGSVKGYDEYAFNCNFTFEAPQQALFIVHPTHGVTYRMPVQCDAYENQDRIPPSEKIKVIL
jgi:predicted DNA-binding protein YlxM (UPF0122 family)/predicted MPP superfamily phosphohydrolase